MASEFTNQVFVLLNLLQDFLLIWTRSWVWTICTVALEIRISFCSRLRVLHVQVRTEEDHMWTIVLDPKHEMTVTLSLFNTRTFM